MDKLEERIRVHDKDIERMCNYHYQGFIESVNELLKVRGEARKLKVFLYSVAKRGLSMILLFPAFLITTATNSDRTPSNKICTLACRFQLVYLSLTCTFCSNYKCYCSKEVSRLMLAFKN